MTNPKDQPEFLNVHEVLAEAQAETAEENVPWTTQTFRIPVPLKELTERICKSNGTDTSKFLRKCCEVLVKDYLPKAPTKSGH